LGNVKSLVKEGEKVFPAQPLGIILFKSEIKVSVYEITGNGSLTSIPFLYSNKESGLFKSTQINGLKVVHLPAIIEKELTGRELKKSKKGTLYKVP
jgi:hypothetical protein